MILPRFLLGWALLLVLLLLPNSSVEAVLPTAQIDLVTLEAKTTSTTTLLASHAWYGPRAPMASRRGVHPDADSDANSDSRTKLLLAPSFNPLLCDNTTSSSTSSTTSSSTTTSNNNLYKDAILLVPRGLCSYQMKTWVAQQVFGAKGLVIYNTLKARYGLNESTTSTSTSSIVWPLNGYDYDCNRAQAWIPYQQLSFSPLPYDDVHNDPKLSGTSAENLCRTYSRSSASSTSSSTTGSSSTFDQHCPSERCFITGRNQTRAIAATSDVASSDNSTLLLHYEACCAWDLHQHLYPDDSLLPLRVREEISIPTLFVTMQQGQDLLSLLLLEEQQQQQVYATLSSRWKLETNCSSLLIWLLGVAVAAGAAYYSASDYHNALIQRQRMLSNNRAGAVGGSENRQPQMQIQPQPRSALQEETLELEPIHALGFIVMASSSLFILFYFKIYGIVTVFYAFGCSNAVIQVLIRPLVERLRKRLGMAQFWIYRARTTATATTGASPEEEVEEEPLIPSISNVDACAMVIGYSWALLWLYQSFTMLPHTTTTFFWITQNIFGTSMCVMFLGLIRLNSIQVASILLLVAFVYDIFFVFVTPYLFHGESIMITVATSGGPPKADELWCEKYPSDVNCQGGDPLPMLLTIPRFFDYEGGSSLLGLGDIVLPGLLLSFAARLDAAKALVAVVSGDRGGGGGSGGGDPYQRERLQQLWGCMFVPSLFGRFYYFGPLVIAYAIGLGMANVAVYVMKMGQPALLYLVPCCLGTMVCLGWHRHELRQLWEGPKVLETAEHIVFGTPRLPPQAMATITSSCNNTITGTSHGGATSNEDNNVDLGSSNQKSMTGNFHHDDEIEDEDDETGSLLHRQPEQVNGEVAA